MIQKFVPMVYLVAACLLSPWTIKAGVQAAPPDPQAEISDAAPAAEKNLLVEDKFRKLQKEMEGAGTEGRKSAAAGKSSATETGPLKSPEARSIGSLAFQILLGLVFVLLLAVVTIRLLKRLQGRMLAKPGKSGKSSGNFFEVLETCHLGTNQRVVALRINEEVGVLGVTPQGINLLTVLKEPASQVQQSYARESNSVAFSENLNKLLERFKKPKRVSDLLDEVEG